MNNIVLEEMLNKKYIYSLMNDENKKNIFKLIHFSIMGVFFYSDIKEKDREMINNIIDYVILNENKNTPYINDKKYIEKLDLYFNEKNDTKTIIRDIFNLIKPPSENVKIQNSYLDNYGFKTLLKIYDKKEKTETEIAIDKYLQGQHNIKSNF